MSPRAPVSELQTHSVTNQPPPFEDVNLFRADRALQDAVAWASGDALVAGLTDFGARVGAAETLAHARLANENPPVLQSFDRYGQRLDEVEFHPSYHALMSLGLDAGISSTIAGNMDHGHLRHGAMMILMNQADAGVTCPMSMTYASAAALAADDAIAGIWLPRIAAGRYDPRFIPASEKRGVTLGMAMTEKQGGSDVRANTTAAIRQQGGDYLLQGHKWFCSAPMSDAFLTLAQTPDGLTCFLVPRWRPDGSRNAIHIMRLKAKMGDRSNASSEIEYHDAWAQRLGDEGRGIPTIIRMVQLTRYDCVLGSTGGMRAALSQALWHTAHRRAFQKTLIDQPAMRAVLADMALEVEAATALAMRLGHGLDAGQDDPTETALQRLAIPAAKFWICKRQPGLVAEALECLGGAGFIEDGVMPRLYRQSPLNAVWEGSGNVIALDVLRALARHPDCVEALQAELAQARGHHDAYDQAVERLDARLQSPISEADARGLTRDIALALQAAALFRTAPDFVFHAFADRRLGAGAAPFYGDIGDLDAGPLIDRAMPTQ